MLQGVQSFSPAMRAFVSMVREYTRDHAELNRLIKGQESSDRMIAWATLDAISNFNGTPPFIGTFSLEMLLNLNQAHLLLRMTVEALLESVALLQTRNHINYSDGGLNGAMNDKVPLIMNWLQYYRSYTEQMKQRAKVAINIGNILGTDHLGVHSELWSVNASYLSY